MQLEGRQFVSRSHALEDTIQELVGQLDPGLAGALHHSTSQRSLSCFLKFGK